MEVLRSHEVSAGSVRIGSVLEGPPEVQVRNSLGALRSLDMLSGEQLPRIC